MTVAVFETALAAHAARTKLESEEIECFIADENMVSLNWLYASAVGGAKLQVHPADYDRALKLLSETAPLPPESQRTEVQCPNCGLTHVQVKQRNHCQGCGHEWGEGP